MLVGVSVKEYYNNICILYTFTFRFCEFVTLLLGLLNESAVVIMEEITEYIIETVQLKHHRHNVAASVQLIMFHLLFGVLQRQ